MTQYQLIGLSMALLGESFDPLLTRCKLLSTHSQEAPVGLTFSQPLIKMLLKQLMIYSEQG